MFKKRRSLKLEYACPTAILATLATRNSRLELIAARAMGPSVSLALVLETRDSVYTGAEPAYVVRPVTLTSVAPPNTSK